MKARMSNAKRTRLLRQAQEIAVERATQWWVWASTTGGDVKQARLVQAKTEKEALRKVRRSIAARPSLPSSVWQDIYEEVGL